MAHPSTARICGLCGEDCSSRPRTKDKAGKYFCKSCYDAEITRRRSASPTVRSRSAAPVVEQSPDDDLGMLGALLDEQLAKGQTQAPPQLCPSCRAPLEQGAQLCVSCGYNMQSGKALSVKVKKPPREPILGAWTGPLIFGAIVIAILAIGYFAAPQSDAFAGVFLLAVMLGWFAYLFWVVRAAGVQGGTLLALAVFFVPLFYLYFVFAQHPGRYLKVATLCQLLSIATVIGIASEQMK